MTFDTCRKKRTQQSAREYRAWWKSVAQNALKYGNYLSCFLFPTCPTLVTKTWQTIRHARHTIYNNTIISRIIKTQECQTNSNAGRM